MNCKQKRCLLNCYDAKQAYQAYLIAEYTTSAAPDAGVKYLAQVLVIARSPFSCVRLAVSEVNANGLRKVPVEEGLI